MKLTQKWYVTLRHPKMHSHTKFGNSTIKNIRKYASESIPILETRSEVKVKDKVIRVWYAASRHPKMHACLKFGIQTSKIIRDMLQTRILKKQGQRSRSGSLYSEYGTRHSTITRCLYTLHLGFLPQII